MGSFKKESARKERQGKNAGGLGNVKTKGENFYRYGFDATVEAFNDRKPMSVFLRADMGVYQGSEETQAPAHVQLWQSTTQQQR